MVSFNLSAAVTLIPRTTNQVHVTGITLDPNTGVLSWVAYDNAGFIGEGRRYSATLTGPQQSAVRNIITGAMAADLGVAVT